MQRLGISDLSDQLAYTFDCWAGRPTIGSRWTLFAANRGFVHAALSAGRTVLEGHHVHDNVTVEDRNSKTV